MHRAHEVFVPICHHWVAAAFEDSWSLEVLALILGSIWTLVCQPCEPVFHLLFLELILCLKRVFVGTASNEKWSLKRWSHLKADNLNWCTSKQSS